MSDTKQPMVEDFKVWFDKVWLGDMEHGQFIPAPKDADYVSYMSDYTLAHGAYQAATAHQSDVIASMQSTIDELVSLLDKAQYCVVIASDYRYDLAGSDDLKCNEYNELNVKIYNKLEALAKVKAK